VETYFRCPPGSPLGASRLFWKFDEKESAVESNLAESTYNDLKVANTRIKAMLKNVDDIPAFLNLAAEAVRLAEFPVDGQADRCVDQKGA
jgi:hypothetical protein